MIFPCLFIEQARCFNPIPSVFLSRKYCLSATKYFNGVYWYLNNSQSKSNSHNYEQMVFKVIDNHISTRLKNKTKWLIIGKQCYPKVIWNVSSKIDPLMVSHFLSVLKKFYLNLFLLIANKQKEHSYTYLALWGRCLVFAFLNMNMNLVADYKRVKFQMKTYSCNV